MKPISKLAIVLTSLLTSKHTLAAVAAGATTGTAAVVLKFDDPIAWGCAAAGVAFVFLRIESANWKISVSNGIVGVMLGVFCGPWITQELSERVSSNPIPGYFVAFASAAFWPWVIKYLWPILVEAKGSIKEAIIKIIIRWGEK